MPSEFDSRYVASGWLEEPDHSGDSPTEDLCRGSSELAEVLECERTAQEMVRLGVADVGAAPGNPVPAGPGPAGPTAGAELVPGYRLVGRIGEGGSGEVWKAIGPGGLPVAMKFVRVAADFGPSHADRQRLRANLRALELMREVRHAHLLPLFGAWHRDGLLIFIMELADCTLIDRYNEAIRGGEIGIPMPELMEAMRQAACGIDYLNAPRHALIGRQGMGILHRDIKPQNLLLVGGCVKVGDFGQAKLLEDTERNTGSLTAYYAPPELFDGLMARLVGPVLAGRHLLPAPLRAAAVHRESGPDHDGPFPRCPGPQPAPSGRTAGRRAGPGQRPHRALARLPVVRRGHRRRHREAAASRPRPDIRLSARRGVAVGDISRAPPC